MATTEESLYPNITTTNLHVKRCPMTQLSHDQLHRFIFDNSDIRGEIVTLTQSIHDAFAHQRYPAPIKHLLGEFLTAVSLLSRTLKFNGSLTLQARGDGDLPLIMAEINHQKKIRCVAQVNTPDDLDNRTLASLLGKGILSIIIDPDKGERYQGIVALEGDTLAQCLEAYFLQSEQLPTKIWLSVTNNSGDDTVATGMLLQQLPQQLASVEDNLDIWETQVHLASTVSNEELVELDHKTLLTRLFHERGVRVFDAEPIAFSCSCSRKRTDQTLTQLGRATLQQILEEEEKIVVDCHFCGFKYCYLSTDIDTLFMPITQH
jgi:molecular chaperone Hsp33